MYPGFKVHYLPEHHLALCQPVGVQTEEGVAQLVYFSMGAEETAAEPFDRLLDLSLVTEFRFQSAVIYSYADVRREAINRLPPFRTAIIAPRSDAQEVARIYQTLMHGSKVSVSIFADAKSAVKWLGVPETVLEPDTAHHA